MRPSSSRRPRSPEWNQPLVVDRERRVLGVVVVVDEAHRPAHQDLAVRARRLVGARLRVEDAELDAGERLAGRLEPRLQRVVSMAERVEAAVLGPAEGRDLRHGREHLLHPAQRAGRPDVDHRVERDPLGVEARMVEDLEPDRLERGEGDRAALPLELVDPDVRIEARADVDERHSRVEARRERHDRAHVEERKRRPHPVVGPERARGRVRGRLRRVAGLRVDAALRVRGRAGGVEDDRRVVGDDLLGGAAARSRGRSSRRPPRSPSSSTPTTTLQASGSAASSASGARGSSTTSRRAPEWPTT